MIDGPVVLDVDVDLNGLTIGEGATLTFDPDSSNQLISGANVVVLGNLVMRPSQPDVQHRLSFRDVNESAYVGDGMAVLDSDVGLWVTADGTLDIAGSPKVAWTRATGSLAAGARSVELEVEPTGWQVGDELVITPTETPRRGADGDRSDARHHADVATVAAINGRTIELNEALEVAHPRVDLGPGGSLGAEVLNLTRNVMIEGTPDGRAHVMIVHADRAQSLRYLALRHLGPNQDGEDVVGRYALHFHHCGDGSAGSMIEGVVARDTGAHAFVPHESNGTTFRDCIAHETHDHAYWWDGGDQSADTLFERCVASNTQVNEDTKYTNAGFRLGSGPPGSNTVRDCVAVNVDGFGFNWYGERAGVWVATGCVAHNMGFSGVWVWQNADIDQVVNDFVCYRNDEFGIDQGAYGTAYHYEGGRSVDNGIAPLGVGAVSFTNDRGGLTFSGLYLDAAGADYGIIAPDGAPVKASSPTTFENCQIVNATKAGIVWEFNDEEFHDALGVVRDCTFDGNEVWLEDGVGAASRIEFYGSRFGDVVLRPIGQGGGQVVPEWNAAMEPL